MIERERLDERTATETEMIVTGLVWLVSLLAFAASVYGMNQLDPDRSPKILLVLLLIGIAVSFLAAGLSTYFVFYGLVRYLYYAKVRATLVLSTDRGSYRPGDDVRVSVSIDTDQSLYILSGRARLLWDTLDGDWVLSEVSLRPGQHLSPGESYESTVVLQLPSDANPAGGGRSENPLKVDVSLKTSPRADAKVEVVVVLLEPVVDLAARSAWLEWLEHMGCQPSLVWEDNLVDSRRNSWISPGAIRCADGPVRYVEFRSMCREGHQGVLNEVRVHLEASWAQRWAPDLYFSLDPTSAEYDEECADCGWTWNDLELGLIERLYADDPMNDLQWVLIERLYADESIGDLWDGPTIESRPLDGEPEPADPHGVSASEVVLTWSRTTLWPVLSWSAPPQESYDALDRLLGYLIAGPEWLPP